MIEQGLFERLRDDVVIAALVSGRVFPVVIPQSKSLESSATPCVVFTLTTQTRTLAACDAVSMVEGTYQIDSLSRSYFEAKEIADAIRLSLNSFTGQMGETHVDRVLLETAQDLIDAEPGLYRVSQTYLFYYQES